MMRDDFTILQFSIHFVRLSWPFDSIYKKQPIVGREASLL